MLKNILLNSDLRSKPKGFRVQFEEFHTTSTLGSQSPEFRGCFFSGLGFMESAGTAEEKIIKGFHWHCPTARLVRGIGDMTVIGQCREWKDYKAGRTWGAERRHGGWGLTEYGQNSSCNSSPKNPGQSKMLVK